MTKPPNQLRLMLQQDRVETLEEELDFKEEQVQSSSQVRDPY